jgi:hypothetical protein
MSNPNKNRNFYNLIPKSLKTKYHNPQYSNHLIKIPARILLIGKSGSGKTSTLLELIHRMTSTFSKIIICVKNRSEPLYDYLSLKIPNDGLEFYEGIDNIPDVDEFKDYDKNEQILIVFDDLVLDKKQEKIEQYFIRGRKIAGGITSIYLSQNYFKTPKNIRLQCNYILLKKMSSLKDLNLILSDFNLGIDKKRMLELYKYATHDPLSFLTIDIDNDEENRYRNGFLEIIN